MRRYEGYRYYGELAAASKDPLAWFLHAKGFIRFHNFPKLALRFLCAHTHNWTMPASEHRMMHVLPTEIAKALPLWSTFRSGWCAFAFSLNAACKKKRVPWHTRTFVGTRPNSLLGTVTYLEFSLSVWRVPLPDQRHQRIQILLNTLPTIHNSSWVPLL